LQNQTLPSSPHTLRCLRRQTGLPADLCSAGELPRRCRYRGESGMQRWIGLAVIANDLLVLGRAGP
jgi:hypothetical protein